MNETKQTFSPADWKTVNDRMVELSQQFAKAVSESENSQNGTITKPNGNGNNNHHD